MTDPIPTAKVDDADRERIAAGLLMLVDPADALEAAIARIAYLEERNDELQEDGARLTSDLGQARETISALTSSRARHLGERNDARAEVDRLAALLAAAEADAETQRRAACNLRDALDRVATAAGVADGSGDEVADRIVAAIADLRERSAKPAATVEPMTVALRNAAPAIAAAVEELTAARAEIAALRSQVCRLVSGQAIEGDHLCQHHGADVAALALLSEERAAHAETARDLDALLTALGAQVTPGGQTEAACHARRVADGMRLAKREVPADVEAAIVSLVAAARDATNYELDRATVADHLTAERFVKESVANLRASIAAEIERARAEGRAEATAAPATVGWLLATAPIGAFVEWLSEDHEGWCRTTVGQSQMVISRWFEYPPKWTRPGFGMYPGDLRLPARLVPASEADADPASRGPIGGGA